MMFVGNYIPGYFLLAKFSREVNQNLVAAPPSLIAGNLRPRIQLQREQMMSKMGKKKGRSVWTAPVKYQRARSSRASDLVGQRSL
jgi:hypothetical protein